MDALALLKAQAAQVDNLLTQVVANLTAEQAVWHVEGTTTNPIAATFMHLYFSEDRTVQQRGQGLPTIFEAGGWQERIGFNPDAIWAQQERAYPDAMRAYAAEVHAATQRYLGSLQPADLEQEVEGMRGRSPRATVLTVSLVIHKASHMGEIAALLGSQGVKGFPF